VQLGVLAGVNRVSWSAADAHPVSSGASYATAGTINFQGGIIGQLNLPGAWQLRSGLLLTGKGTTLNYQSYHDTSSLDIWLRYVELPVLLVYQRAVGEHAKGFGGAGFYGAYGLQGAAMGRGRDHNAGPYIMESKVEFGPHNDTQVFPPVVAPFDYGYTLLAGMEHHRVQLVLSYTQGVKTILNPELFYASYKNRVLSLSVAYILQFKGKQGIVR
jgi:hypothetical protein